MASQQPNSKGNQPANGRRRAPKPTLMESYASPFNDDHLQSIVANIRSITDGPAAQPDTGEPEFPQGATPPPSDQPVDQAVDHSLDHETTQSTNRSTGRPDDKPNDWSNERPYGRSNERPDETSSNISNAEPPSVVVLNENQTILYHCIYWLQGKTTSLQRIGQATGISAFTLKHCLRKLRQEQAIHYHGRQNSAGRIGFSADALPCAIQLRGNEHRLRQRLEEISFDRLPITRAIDPGRTRSEDVNGLMNGPLTDPMTRLMDDNPCSSNEKLLQGLILEKSFDSLNPRSLAAYLDRFETAEALQDFLDMANACVEAVRQTDSPIRNPKGFLISRLKAGYINPPDGYKSRRLQAQEIRNRQLEAELEEMRRLKAKEQDLELEVFRTGLTPERQERLLVEAQARVDPRGLVSEARQLEMAKEDILRTWLRAEHE